MICAMDVTLALEKTRTRWSSCHVLASQSATLRSVLPHDASTRCPFAMLFTPGRTASASTPPDSEQCGTHYDDCRISCGNIATCEEHFVHLDVDAECIQSLPRIQVWMCVCIYEDAQGRHTFLANVPSCAREITRVAVLDDRCASHTAIDPSAPPETGIGCDDERSTPLSSSGTCVIHVTAPLWAPVRRMTTCHLST